MLHAMLRRVAALLLLLFNEQWNTSFSEWSLTAFLKSSEIVGTLRNKNGKSRKALKTIFRQMLRIFGIFGNFRVFGNGQKTLETLEEFLECNVKFTKKFYNIPV